MNLVQGDIILKNNSIWVRHTLVSNVCGLTENFEAVVRNKYKKTVQSCYHHHNILPDTKKSWRWAKINHDFYYDLKRIPNRSPNNYRDMFGDADVLLENYQLTLKQQETNLLEAEFTAFVNKNYKYFLSHYEDCTAVQRPALAKACAAIQFTGHYISSNEITGNKIFRQICEIIKDKDMRYLPKNYRILKQKFEDYDSGIALEDIIKLPRSGNNNAKVFDDPELQAAALKLRSYGENFTNEYIIRKIQDLCEIKGRRVPSRRWFGQKVFELNETKFLTDHLRYGFGENKAFKNTGYIPLERALYAGDCWQVDATKVNLIAHKKEKSDNKKGNKQKTLDHLVVVAVRDTHSGDILGYAFDYSENRHVYAHALKMAVENAGYLAFELIIDRFPGHNTEEITTLFDTFKKLKVRINITSNANGKPHVERGFSTLQTVFMQDSKYYYGEGIKSSRPYAHRSPEYLKEIKKQASKEGFDLTASYMESQNIIEAYRSTPLSKYSRKHAKVDRSPAQIHQESEKPNVRQVSAAQLSMLFGLKKQTTIKHDGLIITDIHNAEYIYQVNDYEVMKKYKNVTMSYDLEDLSTVHLFEKMKDNMYIHIAQVDLFNKPKRYGTGAEWDRITAEKRRIQEIRDRKAEDLHLQTVGSSEVDFLMGRFTSKSNSETERILNDTRYENKRTAKSDIYTDDGSDIDLDDFVTGQM